MAYKQRWDDFFKVFDADGSGDITQKDANVGFQNFARWMKFSPDSAAYKEGALAYEQFIKGFIASCDANGDGVVTKQEFHANVEKLIAAGKSAIPDWWRQAIVMLFRSIDLNNNGDLSLDELKVYARNFNPALTDAEIAHAYDWAKKLIGKPGIDPAGFEDLIWAWSSLPDVHPEFDIIFAYWKFLPK